MRTFAMPKSRIFTIDSPCSPPSWRNKLAGFTSRWTTPCSCAFASPEGGLVDDLERGLDSERPYATHHVGQILPDETLHHHVWATGVIVGAHVEDADDVTRLDRARGASFTLEADEDLRLHVSRHDDFDRDARAGARVHGLEDRAHPALPDELGDAVLPGDDLIDQHPTADRTVVLTPVKAGRKITAAPRVRYSP